MKYTDKDIDNLTAAMFVFIHATECVVRHMINAMEERDRNSKEYKIMLKAHGKAIADAWLRNAEVKIALQAKGNMLHQWLERAKALMYATERATEVGLMSAHEGVTEFQLGDALINDVNWIVRLFFLNGNVDPADYIKVESTIKQFGLHKEQPVSQELIDLFRPK